MASFIAKQAGKQAMSNAASRAKGALGSVIPGASGPGGYRKGAWKDKWFALQNDVEKFVVACACPCISAAQTAERVQKFGGFNAVLCMYGSIFVFFLVLVIIGGTQRSSALEAVAWMLTWLFLALVPMGIRRRLQNVYSIEVCLRTSPCFMPCLR